MPDAIVAAAAAEEARAEADTVAALAEAESAPVVVVDHDSTADQHRDVAIGSLMTEHERIVEWQNEQRAQLAMLASGQEAHMGVMEEIRSQLSQLRATLESHEDDLATLQEAASSEPPSVLESVLPPPEETAPAPPESKHRRGRIVHGHARRK